MSEVIINFIAFFFGVLASEFIRRFQILNKLLNRFRKSKIQQTPYWHSKVKLWDELPSKAKIVMVGDSITEGADWSEILQNNMIVNRGISGDTTSGLLKRVHQVVELSPSIVFIMIGVNDFGSLVDVDTVFDNYKNIIKVLKDRKIIVVVQSTVYSGEKYKAVNSNIRSLNERLSRFCQCNSINYLDLNSALSSPDGLKKIYTYDGIHLSADGYLVWKEIIQRTLNDIGNQDIQ